MPEQESGTQGQESGTATQGQGQESASQQQGTDQGQESSGPDISTMAPEELRTYAATLQRQATDARRQAATYRTQAQEAQGKVTEAERAQMSEQQRIQADLDARTQEVQELREQVQDFTVGTAVREALATANAISPATAQKVMGSVPVGQDGKPVKADLDRAIAALKESDPYLFKRNASADAGAGRGQSPDGAGGGINDFIRGRTGR